MSLTYLLKSKLVINYSHLSFVTLFNLAIPLLTYPYLIRILGSDMMGYIFYCQSIFSFIVLFIAFGFNSAATREMSINIGDAEKINIIVSSVFTLKIVLFIISFLIFFIIKMLLKINYKNQTVFWLTAWMPLNEIIFPIWYFQGKEEMNKINFLNFISKIILLILIFLLIKSPSDYYYFPIINLISVIIISFFSVYQIFIKDEVKFKFLSIKMLLIFLINSTSLFFASLSVTIFTQLNKVIIGNILGMSEVAYFDLADKIIQLLKMPQIILSQLLFPKFSKSYSKVRLVQYMKISFLFSIIMVIIFQFSASKIVLLLGGIKMEPAIQVLHIFLFVIPIIYLSQYTSTLTLLVNKKDTLYLKILISSSIIYVSSILLFYLFFNITVISLVFCTIFSELFLLLISLYFSKNLNFV